MPFFPESSSPGASKLAIIVFGGGWVLYGLTIAYQGIVIQKITRRTAVVAQGIDAVHQGMGWLCLALIAAFLTYKGIAWIDNSEY